jgi:hypothetical protein
VTSSGHPFRAYASLISSRGWGGRWRSPAKLLPLPAQRSSTCPTSEPNRRCARRAGRSRRTGQGSRAVPSPGAARPAGRPLTGPAARRARAAERAAAILARLAMARWAEHGEQTCAAAHSGKARGLAASFSCVPGPEAWSRGRDCTGRRWGQSRGLRDDSQPVIAAAASVENTREDQLCLPPRSPEGDSGNAAGHDGSGEEYGPEALPAARQGMMAVRGWSSGQG